ncbi:MULTISPECIES: PhzF family phenazine biosynthesis protein [Inquilinus]|uniref:PhzF family phenazine biosynthesis protein n=1 Tax=Inquilinus ginsengisoli TaxID=363840 RepID=A0ABU1K0Q2_9PROT|nr:PhzF family phenazine biosynthesis protein [Inquilinus ginsengisoli]MDR6294143.1 PhzF family phenazine biosynthesis protein [Inquilinus ginsengisoli]
MRELTMHQVDAFADRVFGGNPAAVLVLDDWLPDAVLQAIAEENNLAETAFARRAAAGWDLRWFTPVHEVDFCGHATLATAHVLAAELGEAGELAFHTRVGRLAVTRTDDRYVLDIPALPPEPADPPPSLVAELFGGQVQAVFRNFENLFVELPDEAAVRAVVPDLLRIAGLHPLGLVVTGRGASADIASRYFAPSYGIPEDPVTGSIHATLVPYWAAKLGRTVLSAVQCSRRGGRLGCRLQGDRVLLSGQAVTFMRGVVRLPG